LIEIQHHDSEWEYTEKKNRKKICITQREIGARRQKTGVSTGNKEKILQDGQDIKDIRKKIISSDPEKMFLQD